MADWLDTLKFPDGLDEGDVLSWVEGEPMLASKRAALAAWMARDARVAGLLQGMRADRDALRSLPEEPAPAGLIEGISSQIDPLLERQMLLGLASGTDLSEHPPVSVVRPPRSGILSSLFADRTGRRIAVAAAGLLLVGGSTYFIAQAMTGPDRGPRGMSITRGPSEGAAGATSADSPSKTSREESLSIAATSPIDPPAPEIGSTALQRATAIAVAPSTENVLNPASLPDAAPLVLADAAPAPEMGPFPTGTIDAVRAVELAREGRLIVRVEARDFSLAANPARVPLRLRSASGAAWTVEGEAPASIAALVTEREAGEFRERRLPEPEPIILAGSMEPTRYPGEAIARFMAPPAPMGPSLADAPKVYSVQVRLEPANLTRMEKTLRGVGGEVIFEEAAEPLPVLDEPALRPQAVLWWGQSPAGWTRWARVPVVVDLAR